MLNKVCGGAKSQSQSMRYRTDWAPNWASSNRESCAYPPVNCGFVCKLLICKDGVALIEVHFALIAEVNTQFINRVWNQFDFSG